MLDAGNKSVDIRSVIVECDACAAAGKILDAKPREERLGAVMPRADTHARHIHDACYVVWMNASHVETYDAVVKRGVIRADDVNIIEFGELLHEIGDKRLLTTLHGFIANGVCKVIKRHTGRIDACSVLCAGFELLGNRRPDGILLGDRIDHFAAGEHRRHLVKQLVPTPKDADAHGAKRLMGAKGKEIGAELAHVDCHVRRRLRTVHHYVGAIGMCCSGDFLYRVAHAEDIRDLADGDNLGSGTDLCGDLVIGDDSLVIGTQVDQRGTGFAASLLPGNEIGVMLHDRYHDLIAGREDRSAE